MTSRPASASLAPLLAPRCSRCLARVGPHHRLAAATAARAPPFLGHGVRPSRAHDLSWRAVLAPGHGAWYPARAGLETAPVPYHWALSPRCRPSRPAAGTSAPRAHAGRPVLLFSALGLLLIVRRRLDVSSSGRRLVHFATSPTEPAAWRRCFSAHPQGAGATARRLGPPGLWPRRLRCPAIPVRVSTRLLLVSLSGRAGLTPTRLPRWPFARAPFSIRAYLSRRCSSAESGRRH